MQTEKALEPSVSRPNPDPLVPEASPDVPEVKYSSSATTPCSELRFRDPFTSIW